jgi:hypothetical protein
VVSKTNPQSEGASFAEGGGGGGRGGRGGRGGSGEPFDKKHWKDREHHKCGKSGHPALHCKGSKKKEPKDDDDDKSLASAASSVRKLKKDLKSMSKAFATVKEQLKESESSGLSGSEEEDSHFQIDTAFQFTQVEQEATLEFEPRIEQLFKQAHLLKKLDLREIMLLDDQSTTDLFCNDQLVLETHESRSTMRLRSNGGSMSVTRRANMSGYRQSVWFSKGAITNIVALSNMTKQHRVTCDSNDETVVIHREKSGLPNMQFRKHESGLHCYDPRDDNGNLVFNTVSKNMELFLKRQVKEAETAHWLHATLSYPSLKDFKWVTRSDQIKNCPVTAENVDVALKIWGKNIAALKGKTTRKKPDPVARDMAKVPMNLLQLHKEVFMTLDVFFVNSVPFFLTLSRKTCFTAVTQLANRTVPQIFKAFKEIYQHCLQQGFRITTVHADGEFAPLQTLIASMPGGPLVNLTSANEHVPDIERRIRVVKERARATRHGYPFPRIPKLLTIETVLCCVKSLNFFPPKGGISDVLSPKATMSGKTLDCKRHLSLQIGQCCQAHEEEAPRNSQIARTKGAIALGPSGNIQGGFKFMALNTGKKIVRRNWDVTPMPDTVIARVNKLGKDN